MVTGKTITNIPEEEQLWFEEFTQSANFIDKVPEFYMREIVNEEAELDEFYLFASGKYSKKLRQVFSNLELDKI
jgi:hypothetical protein